MAKKNKESGEARFSQFYQEIYLDRWHTLVQAMKKEKIYLALEPSDLRATPYYLDKASVVAALSLQVRPGQKVLDLCAAPGGKSLVVLRRLFPDFFPKSEFVSFDEIENELGLNPDTQSTSDAGTLTANEKSANRRKRLFNNLQAHLPSGVVGTKVSITHYDGVKIGLFQPSTFDRVLADVPCSSEAHVLEDAKYLDQWSPARTKHLSIQAGAIGLSGFDALRPGGILVYATCALSPLENQEVVRKILRKRPLARLLNLPRVPSWIEELNPGYGIFPDRAEGLGPLYFSILTKQDHE